MNYTTHTRRLAGLIATLATAALLALPGIAAAQSPTDDQYGDNVTKTENAAGGSDVGADQASGGGGSGGSSSGGALGERVVGTLPFTGFDLIALGAIALALVSMGLALRRLSAPRHEREFSG